MTARPDLRADVRALPLVAPPPDPSADADQAPGAERLPPLPPEPKQNVPTEMPPHAKQTALDMSRSVTLTGAELQIYVRSVVAQTQADAAAQAAAPVTDKIQSALTPPTDPAPAE